MTRIILPAVFLVFTFMIAGCSVTLEESIVNDSIIKHFNSRNYAMTVIEIEKIEAFPISKREYMAPKKYTVYIAMIKLEAGRASAHNKPETFIFKNAVITISGTDKHNEWRVDNISGIPLS